MKRQQGFTLIELMIVIAIIGILAAVAIPAYTDYLNRAKVSEAFSLLTGLKPPIEEYMAVKGQFPDNIALLGQVKASGKYVDNISYTANATYGEGYIALMKNNLGEIAMLYEAGALGFGNIGSGTWRCVRKSNMSISHAPSSCVVWP